MNYFYHRSIRWLFCLLLLANQASMFAQTNVDAGAVFAATLDSRIWSINITTAKATPLTTSPFTPNGINSLALNETDHLIYYTAQSGSNTLYAYDYIQDTHIIIKDLSQQIINYAPTGFGLGKGGADFRNGILYLCVENMKEGPASVVTNDIVYKITFLDGTNGTKVNTVTPIYRAPSANDWGDIIVMNDSFLINNIYQKIELINLKTGAVVKSVPKLNLGQIAMANNGTFWNIDEDIQRLNADPLSPDFGQMLSDTLFINLDCMASWNVPVSDFDPGRDAIDAAGPVPTTNKIGDLVWKDSNCNGIYDAAFERGIGGAKIELWDDVNINGVIDGGKDRLLSTATSASDGTYEFSNILPGDYIIRLKDPSTLIPGGIVTSNKGNDIIIQLRGLNRAITDTDFGVENCFLLPVSMKSFEVDVEGCKPVLKWVTTNEINCAYYNIERSIDGEHFETVGIVYAKGFGSVGEQSYTFEDIAVKSEIYYRLKMVDSDNSYTYTGKQSVNIDCTKDSDVLMVYPNPVSNVVNVQLHTGVAGMGNIIIRNTTHQDVKVFEHELTAGINLIPIDVSELPSGTYFIMVANSKQSAMSTQKFVKL